MGTIRHFSIGEIVFNCDTFEEDNFDYGVITLINGKAEDADVEEDAIITLSMAHNDFEGDNECCADQLYKLCKEQTYLCGEPICYEHKDFEFEGGENYPYYIPNNDENYFEIELDAIAQNLTEEERKEIWEKNKWLFEKKIFDM